MLSNSRLALTGERSRYIVSSIDARSLAEIIEMQTSFVRRQVELATDQAKEMQQMSQSVARDVTQPAREAAQQASGKDAF